MTRSTQELIAAAETHLDASAMSRFSTANGIELLTALKREHATVAALRKALEDIAAWADERSQAYAREAKEETRSAEYRFVCEGSAGMASAIAIKLRAALRDPAGKET